MSNDTSEAKVVFSEAEIVFIKEMRCSVTIKNQWRVPSVLLWDDADEDGDDVELELGDGFEESYLSEMILNSPVAVLVRSYTYNDFGSYYTMTDGVEERDILWKLLKFNEVDLPPCGSSDLDRMDFDVWSGYANKFTFNALKSKGSPADSSRSPDHIIAITEENVALINSIFKTQVQPIHDSICLNCSHSLSEFELDYLLLMNERDDDDSLYYYGDECPEEAKELTMKEMIELLQVPSVPSSFGVFVFGNTCDKFDDDVFEELLDEYSEKIVSEDKDEQYKQYARLHDLRALTSLKKVLEDNREALGIVSELEDVGNKLVDEYYIGFVFNSTGSLENLDDIFLKISFNFSRLYVYDFTHKIRQGYSEGEYDTGSLSYRRNDYDYYSAYEGDVAQLFDVLKN
ncbi:hypothetical protein CKO12_04350 [Chromatium okenii]|uniref:hypothetical protein n=1 Tax=Chromatium okenii TaxID=61644 RepID=UPI0019041D62|nr:hypothetical protein [Chromatium okenii]MBK1641116.1 hypothetical protein [Chromatium okenii]